MKKRIFIALPVSESLQNEIIAWEQSFSDLPVRWLKGKNLHITLVPPWEIDDTDKIVTLLNGSKFVTERIELRFDRVSFGPNPREPRLIWAEGQTVNQLSVIRNQLYETLGFSPESRPYKLHLTLARFRPEQFASFPTQTLNEKVTWQDTATSFVLMESHLLPTGADYEILVEIPL
ncbi:2'-5' RNA ligase [Candidatus Uhrbacteria bacterium RIFCSPLOWO2_02_FULL_49_11]|uniref:RNA 2',3'-cyclic phosphodiesterase n=1 Tax=Candidatus Uhrbacteria bacterium RIFCSPLOWO2_02_FULL_49_11 TaxID=1802409 RepID=A0A1F7VD95_9BACT|nr:MAG: 2'-5' RNA ligase [Candidatus Uhrbacteria bacterium RIFCSPLOWO2_02_FULL_49_11]